MLSGHLKNGFRHLIGVGDKAVHFHPFFLPLLLMC